ncbi:MAG: DUF6879 family protein [Chloroflexota bacterium]
MDSQAKMLDRLQIVGFVISASISLVLILTRQDTVASVSLGLLLATLTQLFDLQLRQSMAEERLLKANALSQAIYRDEWLFKNIRQIVDEYEVVKRSWFKLFTIRAKDAITESRHTLHTMAEGYLIAEQQGRYAFGSRDFRTGHARKTVKAVAATAASYWQSARADKYFEASESVLRKGVSFTRIFVYPPETLCQMIHVLERQQKAGIEVHVAYPGKIPKELYEDYLIIDDQISVLWEFGLDGHVRHERISTEPAEVGNMTWKFNMLLHYSSDLEEAMADLKMKRDSL